VSKKTLKSSIIVATAIYFGILGILITCLMLYMLKNILAIGSHHKTVFYLKTFVVLDKVEIVVKSIGMLAAIIGIAQKDKVKIYAIVGLVINIMSVIFSILIMFGVI
jgi:hypothetical protein